MKTTKEIVAYATPIDAIEDKSMFVLDLTKLATLTGDKVLVEIEVDSFPIHERIFTDGFFDTVRMNNLGDSFLDACLDHINHEFMKAQVIRHIVEHAE